MVVDEFGKPVGYSVQEREEALTVSLCSIASSLGYTPVRSGGHYSLKEMDSLVIYNDRSWNRWSGKGSITGGTQIDFLMAFGGIDTPPQAIKWLLDFKGSPAEQTYMRNNPIEKDVSLTHRDMVLPPKNANYRRLYAYLIQTRGLSSEVVSDFVHRKLIYEDAVHHNIVYCGYDPEGNIRYAGLRGTADLYGKKFKMDVPGNDKNYGVNIVNKESAELKVFESVIDCMSYIDMYHDQTSNKLILGMVDDHPLAQFLKDYPHIRKISFCLDNDRAGQDAIYSGKTLANGGYKPGLKEKYEELGYEVSVEVPPKGKDFNESLLIMKGKMKEESQAKSENLKKESASNTMEKPKAEHGDNKTYVAAFYENMMNVCGYTRQKLDPKGEMATVKFANEAGRTYRSDGYGDCAEWLLEDPNLTDEQKKTVEQMDKSIRKIHLLNKGDQIVGFYLGDNSNEKYSLLDANGYKYKNEKMALLYLDFDGLMTYREMDTLYSLCTMINNQSKELFDEMKKQSKQNSQREHVSKNQFDEGENKMFCKEFEEAVVENSQEEIVQQNTAQSINRRGGHR